MAATKRHYHKHGHSKLLDERSAVRKFDGLPLVKRIKVTRVYGGSIKPEEMDISNVDELYFLSELGTEVAIYLAMGETIIEKLPNADERKACRVAKDEPLVPSWTTSRGRSRTSPRPVRVGPARCASSSNGSLRPGSARPTPGSS